MQYRLTALGAMPVALALVYLLAPAVAETGEAAVNSFHGVAAISLIVMAVGLLANRPRPLWPWLAMMAASALWLGGDLLHIRLEPTTDVSPASIVYLAGYALLVAALLGFARRRLGNGDPERAIDVAAATLGAAYVVCELVVRPMWEQELGSLAALLLTSVYLVLDVMLLVLLLQMALRPGRPPTSLLVLMAGFGSLFAADIGFATISDADRMVGYSRTLDTLWLITYASFALAACLPSSVELGKPVKDRTRVALAQVVISVLALLTLPAVLIASHAFDRLPLSSTMAGTSLLMVGMIGWRFVRQARTIEDSNQRLQVREAYYRALATNSSDVFVVTDEPGRVIDTSVAMMGLLGASSPEEFRAGPLDFLHPLDRPLVMRLVDDARSQPGRTSVGEVRLRPRDREDHWVELRCINLLHDPAVNGMVINVHDITSRKEVETKLEYQAFHDALTGLANRSLFRDRVDHALAHLPRRGGDVAVLFCDLDDFKSVNDSLGHAAGDDLLRRVAERFANAVRSGDTVARLGGDEFAVLLEGLSDLGDEATKVAVRMLRALSDPMEINDSIVVTTGSIGLALASQGVLSGDELLRNADLAMYSSKRAARNRITLYDPGMATAVANRHDLGVDLRTVVERGELVLHYQPVVELRTLELAGFEALVRWRHPQRGLLKPADFIPIAEDTGLIVPIGEWILRSACLAAVRWTAMQEPGHTPLTMAVNLSARQLEDPELPGRFAAVIAETGMDPSRLVLELTESVLVHQPEEANRHLSALKELGVRLAIDDFGTGYSSLSYLRQFPVDIVKIDQSFVESITHEHVPAITHGLLELGRSLGLETIAEGIEEEAQLLSLAAEGCDLGQGYAIARPLAEEDATGLVRRGRVVAVPVLEGV